MSNLEILETKLEFLRFFYRMTTAPFLEVQRKIENHEEPFVDCRNPEEYDGEPFFLSEWQEAEEGLKLQQQVCLTVLQRSFKEFLDASVQRHSDYENRKPKERGNWFRNYKAWFWEEAGVDWTKEAVSLDRIEELTLARNCVQHGGESTKPGPKNALDMHSLVKMQSNDYHTRFPDGFFASEFEKRIWKEQDFPQPATIELTQEKMDIAIEEVFTFCKFIEEELPWTMAS